MDRQRAIGKLEELDGKYAVCEKAAEMMGAETLARDYGTIRDAIRAGIDALEAMG